MKKTLPYFFLTVVGIVLLASGVLLIKTIEEPQSILGMLPYICVGLGCVTFGHGMGEVILRSAMKRNPTAAKQLEIDRNDERNLAIVNRSKAKAYDMMVFVIGALLLAFALMGIDLGMLLLFFFAYLFIIVYSTYYRYKYDKEM